MLCTNDLLPLELTFTSLKILTLACAAESYYVGLVYYYYYVVLAGSGTFTNVGHAAVCLQYSIYCMLQLVLHMIVPEAHMLHSHKYA